MNEKRPEYISYLMRLWRDDDDGPQPEGGTSHPRKGGMIWRASLESALTGKRHSFASLDALLAYLRRETGLICDGESDDGGAQG